MKLNKNVVKISFLVFVLLFLLILGIILIFNGSGKEEVLDQESQVEALLVVVKPNISIIREDETITVSDDEAELFDGDKVKTDETGLGYIIFSDNSLISFDKDTEIEINEYRDEDGSFVIRIKQIIGRTWSRIENLLGKETDYEVETFNTVASVRGTKFGCDVTENATLCYVIKGSIKLKLKNVLDVEDEITLEQGDSFENNDEEIKKITSYEELLELITGIEVEDPIWQEFIDCLDTQVFSILSLDKYRVLNYLIEHRGDINCGEVLSEEEVEEEGVTTTTTTKLVFPKPSVDNVSISLDEELYSIFCSWSAQNATNYEVSVGTSGGSDDAGSWIATTSNNYTFGGLDLVSGNTYYCNVIASGKGGKTGVITSDGVYFDQSSGYFDPGYTKIFEPCFGCMLYDSIYGRGYYYNAPLDHFRVKFNIENDKAYYYDGSTWSKEVFWHDLSLEPLATDRFSFSKNISISTSEELEIHYVLYNRFSGNVLDEVTISAYTEY